MSKKVFFTSDTHFSHGNIIKYCNRNKFLANEDKRELDRLGGEWHNGDWKGSRSSNWRISQEAVERMNDEFIDNINNMVGQDDTLYHLGDFCFAPKHHYYNAAKRYRDSINCNNITFIYGNHDHRSLTPLFNSCYDLHETHVNNIQIILCHYAMATWNKSHRGSWQLYGHSHANLESWIDKVMPGRRSLDVGVDNAYQLLGEYRPFSFEELQTYMKDRNGFSADHHGMRTGPTEEELTQ